MHCASGLSFRLTRVERKTAFDGLRNFRDLGGYAAAEGRTVRSGLLYRSDSLSTLRPGSEDESRLRALGVRQVIDLRHGREIEATGRVPADDGLEYHHCPIGSRQHNQASRQHDNEGRPQDHEGRPQDDPVLSADLDPGPPRAERFLAVAEDCACEVREALGLIADGGSAATVLVDCRSGADSAGQLAVLVLSLLGVADEDIVADFELTNQATADLAADLTAVSPERTATHTGREASPGREASSGRERVSSGYGQAPGEAVRVFLAGIRERYGSIDAYASEHLDLGAELGTALRERLLTPALVFRLADEGNLPELVRLRDEAARWMLANGIDQWKPGEKGETHFRDRMEEGEVWLATLGEGGPVAGAWELWWADPLAWGEQPSDAGYVHRLMVDRTVAPRGAGRRLLAAAERRIAECGRTFSRLDCVARNHQLAAYYERAGYTRVGEGVQQSPEGVAYPVTLLEKRL